MKTIDFGRKFYVIDKANNQQSKKIDFLIQFYKTKFILETSKDIQKIDQFHSIIMLYLVIKQNLKI